MKASPTEPRYADWTVTTCGQVSESSWDEWNRILDATPRLHSPFLRPGFVRCLAEARDDVRIARWHDETGAACFLPFQQPRGRSAKALGLGIAEWQAIVCRSPEQVCWQGVARQAGWRSFAFDHLYAWQLDSTSARTELVYGDSPWVDLAGGWDHYLQCRRQLGSTLLKQTERRLRKLERERGLVEFQLDAPLEEAFDCLLRWKSAQHHRTGVPDAFRTHWVVQLLRIVASHRSDGFRGRISLLRAGGIPVAVHLGVESERTAHMWYPAYDRHYSHYSPGTILFLKLIEATAAAGLQRLDFGPGGQTYKDRLKTDDDRVVRGVLDTTWTSAIIRRPCSVAARVARAVHRSLTRFLPTTAALGRS
ncbi:MAG: GNAT family N-acetyltransferase [Planctomycetales bacterium]|nr:GNAT family N-acetyltransferase [Planctomycetales bacterium]